jgi:hypothetical protein
LEEFSGFQLFLLFSKFPIPFIYRHLIYRRSHLSKTRAGVQQRAGLFRYKDKTHPVNQKSLVMKTIALYLCMALLTCACHSEKEENLMSVTETADYRVSSEPPAMAEMVKFAPPEIKDDAVEEEVAEPVNVPATKNKKIIRDGSISIRVKRIDQAKKHMDSLVKNVNGYYEQEEFNNDNDASNYTLKVRVPSAAFERFLSGTEKGTGEVTTKTINTRDVTEEYTDTEVRLNSKKLFRRRYNELLTRAAKVDDILAIEENIRGLQEEIESREGRLKYLDDQVAYSTMNVMLFVEKENLLAEVKETFGQRVSGSLKGGWESAIAFVLWSLLQWPWAVTALALVLGLRTLLKRRKK